eukprot:m.832964 g.832964  ORF g.832964 m.832964 type:complete len:80 (-) comp23441_c0_seq7:491-730(-)
MVFCSKIGAGMYEVSRPTLRAPNALTYVVADQSNQLLSTNFALGPLGEIPKQNLLQRLSSTYRVVAKDDITTLKTVACK